MKEELGKLRDEAEKKIRQAKDEKELDGVRIEFLGRKQGKITHILRNLKDLLLVEYQ